MNYPNLCIAIAGRNKDTRNYERALQNLGVPCLTTLSTGELQSMDGLILPGGGDITPAFFGEKNTASRNIDTELDILQIQALKTFIRRGKPVLGICKGIQLINLCFGGDIWQNLSTASRHQYQNGDQFHSSTIFADNPLYTLYGSGLEINSAHHQGLRRLAPGLEAIQFADDGVIEGIRHQSLPILGVQWHPERLSAGAPLFSYFVSRVAEAAQKETG